MTKKVRNQITGLILLDKPLGLSSNQAVGAVRRILNAEKVGHTGTLDPLATGLLPLCLGEATKFASYLLDSDKEYLATMQLGVTTDTGDAEGRVISNQLPPLLTSDDLMNIQAQFTGEITQYPPMYSALKHNGKPLYEYARAGIEIERKPRQITIHNLELINYDSVKAQLTFRALVSKGTYIRTLALDIGNLIGCGGSLVSLRRTRTHDFDLSAAYSLEVIEALHQQQSLVITPLAAMFANDIPCLIISDRQFNLVKNGNICDLERKVMSAANWTLGMHQIIYQDNFIGIGEVMHNADTISLHPKRMIKPQFLNFMHQHS